LRYIFLLISLTFWLHANGQTFTISGYISDASNGESLIGATVLDVNSGKGAITNAYGFFSLTLPADYVNLRIQYVGFATVTYEISLQENIKQNFQLNPGDLLDEVVVTADELIEQAPQMSTIDVGVDKIKAIPALMGEQDVLKSIQLLPGIQSGTEGSSGIYVRGGGPDQNLILLDGVPVYNASHLFGFFSVFNPDAVNKVSVIKGGFPARYGGRLSSVIDISMKEGNKKNFSGSGSIGLISSKLTLEGPIKTEKTSFIVSARRTYIDLLARPIIKAASEGDEVGGYFFYDLNTKVNHTFSDKDRIYWSFYGGNDKFYVKSKYDYFSDGITYENRNDTGLGWGNIITAVRWNHVYTPKLFSNLTATYSRYKFNIFYESEETNSGNNDRYFEGFEYKSGINDIAMKLDFDYLPSPSHSIKFGTSGIRHEFNPGANAYRSTEVRDTTIGGDRTPAMEFSAYIEDDFSLGKKLRFNAGMHAAMFNVKGKTYASIQPRLSGRLLLPNNLALKASYAKMTQFIHLLTNGGIGLPTDLWVPATDLVRPQESWQIAAGLAKTYGKYEVSLEGYYKEMSNLIEYKEGASFFNTTDNWESKVESGIGTSYGVEFFVQKKTGRLNGWIGYTWSKTFRQFDNLNFGKEFPYKFDRRHDLSVVGIYNLNDGWDVSATWVYGTGNAISMPQSAYSYFDYSFYQYYYYSQIENYGERNSYRMRAYHRMDISLTKTKTRGKTERSWSFGAYNLYNRKNPFFIDQSWDDQGHRKFVQYSLFPIIPFVKWDIKF
jgi:outer membrane cobalamin receptor